MRRLLVRQLGVVPGFKCEEPYDLQAVNRDRGQSVYLDMPARRDVMLEPIPECLLELGYRGLLVGRQNQGLTKNGVGNSLWVLASFQGFLERNQHPVATLLLVSDGVVVGALAGADSKSVEGAV